MVARKKKKPTPAKKKTPASSKAMQTFLRPDKAFPIVGIGASAGGLEASDQFFSSLPTNLGAAYILVSHLDPTHASILPELIAKKTKMKVQQVVDNMKVVPNEVFIIPPNNELAILNGTLQLLEMSKPRSANLPIDIFFRSLAQDQEDFAIGIILSGTGTDGTLGVRAIKGEGGMVMAQDVESAKYDGMPRSAITTGLVDYILPADKIAHSLADYLKHMSLKEACSTSSDTTSMQSDLNKIFILLRSVTGHDFSNYKSNTICRRIERRMHIHQIDTTVDYIRYLKKSELEVTILFRELLIGVTSFFRDPAAFLSLKDNVLKLLRDKPEDSQVRIWVVGCSTGEEAYSVAIIFQECMKEMSQYFTVQIFATDLDDEAVNIARAGIYPESISSDVSPERRREFFIKDSDQYKIKKNIREMVVFAPQNIIKDPPFTKLDLLCCRNLLIYFNQKLQKYLFPIFNYSLKPGGLLFLGSSETIGQANDLFMPMDKKWKIFARSLSDHAAHPVLHLSRTTPAPKQKEKIFREPEKPMKDLNSLKLLKTIISESDMSTCVVIDDRGNILYIHGRTGRFLEPAEGEASLNILEMARPGLKSGLVNAIRKLGSERQEVAINGLSVQENGGHIELNLIVRPLPDMQTGRHSLMMVIFEEVPTAALKKSGKSGKAGRTVNDSDLNKLEDELQYTKESLQTTIEELETSNEELKSTNEELQSTNEELQSTNEELETSKEELQSLNEEAATVNSELQARIEELVLANDDIKNLLDATDVATVFLDIDFNVRRFTPKATELIPLTTVDIGRPISHFATRLKDVDIVSHANEVLQDLGITEIEIQDTDNNFFRMRMRPYRTANNVIDGVVINFDDISELKELSQLQRLAAITSDSNDAVILHDMNGSISAWNKGAQLVYGYSETEALKMSIFDISPPDKLNEMKKVISDTKKNEQMKSIIISRITKDGETISVWLTSTLLKDTKGQPEFIATTERDLSLLTKSAFKKLTVE